LVQAGHEVDVVCLRRHGERLHERSASVSVWRIPVQHRRGRLAMYVVEYAVVMLIAAFIVGALHLRKRFDVVQVNTPPDSIVFAAIIPRMLGARILLQLQEPMPEFFMTKFNVPADHLMARLVRRAEQTSIRFADFVITCTEHMRQAFVQRGADPSKIAVVVPTSNEDEFDPSRVQRSRRAADSFVLVSHGSIEERYGLDTAIQAVRLLRGDVPGIRLEIYGEGFYSAHLQQLAKDEGVSDLVSFHGWVPLEVLLQAIADADAGVVAMKRDVFRDLTHCLKMYDFIAMGRPVVVSRTLSVEEYFDDDSLQKFIAGDSQDLARAIRELRADPRRADALVLHASRTAEPYRWSHQREFYLDVIARLVSGRSSATPIAPTLPNAEVTGS
jgi:glycosyltransferase involved in cell wall biosynthesis